MTNTRAGRLRHRIRIEKPVRVADGQGGSTVTWELHARPWAEPDNQDLGQDLYAGGLASTTRTMFKMRFVAGVTTEMRVVFDGAEYVIEGIRNPNHRSRQTELLCREARDG